jgi:hypothetical protein
MEDSGREQEWGEDHAGLLVSQGTKARPSTGDLKGKLSNRSWCCHSWWFVAGRLGSGLV